jgi:repressor LexA
LVIVRQQPVAENGDIVVALVDDEATVKRLSIRGHEIELRPENPDFLPLRIGPDHEWRIIGKVVAVRRTAGASSPSKSRAETLQ